MKWTNNVLARPSASPNKQLGPRWQRLLMVGLGIALAGGGWVVPTSAAQAMPGQTGEITESQTVRAYKTASPSVVTINAGNGAGTGVVVDSKCLILTNQHVLGTPQNINVSMGNNQTYRAKLLAASKNPADDLALIQLIDAKGPCSVIQMGDSRQVEVGQQVLAIGNPFGLDKTLTTGIVSRIDAAKNRIQTDAAINPGNSGGPLLNGKGEMIGMNQAILNPDGRSNAGIAFAIPTDVIQGFLAAYRSNDATAISLEMTRSKNYMSQPVTQPYRKRPAPYRPGNLRGALPQQEHVTPQKATASKSLNVATLREAPNTSLGWLGQIRYQGLMQLSMRLFGSPSSV